MAELADNAAGYVSLTFDFDGPSLWIQRGMTTPTSISRGEFGAVAVPRILRLLERRGLPATFFIPGHTIETYPAECAAIAAAGHEIALHGYAHEFNPTVAPDTERWAMARSIELIERLCGTAPDRLPRPVGRAHRGDDRPPRRPRPHLRLVADGPRPPAVRGASR